MNRNQIAAGAAVVVTALGVSSAAAQAPAPRPTLSFDRSCYGEQEVMSFSGQQYTPGGDVTLLFASHGEIGDYTTKADAAGAIADYVTSPDPGRFLGDSDERGTLGVTANDQTRQQDGTLDRDPEATFAPAELTLSRTYARLEPKAPVPGKRLRVVVRGLAEATGRPLYLHYLRGTKSLKVSSLGPLHGVCGDLSKRVGRAFPLKSIPAGRYTLLVSTERTQPTKGIYFKFPVRVRAGAHHR